MYHAINGAKLDLTASMSREASTKHGEFPIRGSLGIYKSTSQMIRMQTLFSQVKID